MKIQIAAFAIVCVMFFVQLSRNDELIKRLKAIENHSRYTFTATIHSMDAIIPPQWIRTELHGREVRVIVEPIE